MTRNKTDFFRNAYLNYTTPYSLKKVLEWAAARRIGLLGINLSQLEITNTKLMRARLDYADLSGADLCDSNLFQAHLKYANLANACLIRANLEGADLTGANLTGADLRGATYDRMTNLEGAYYYADGKQRVVVSMGWLYRETGKLFFLSSQV